MKQRDFLMIQLSIPAIFAMFLFANISFGQCGVPGTPPCPSKSSTTSKKRTTKLKPKPKPTAPLETETARPELIKPIKILTPPQIRISPGTINYEIIRPGCWSPDVPNQAVKCPADVIPEYFPEGRDKGFDLAYVTIDKALLRESPKYPFSVGTACVSTYSNVEIPCEGKFLKRSDVLVLVDRTPRFDWLNVIDIATGTEGWVYKGHLEIYYTSKQKTAPTRVFEERNSAVYGNPEVTIKNNSGEILSVRIGDQKYSISPLSSKTITIDQGNYKYHASAPRVFPLFGEKYFSRGRVYTWTFYIQ